MQVKDIVVVTDLSGDQAPARLAVDLASRADAHITGMAPVLEPITPAYLAGPLPADILEQARSASVEVADKALATFNELVRVQGVSGESARFHLVEGAATGLVHRARLSDLTVIGQDKPDSTEPGRATLIEALLFETGVPLMVVPYISRGAFQTKHMMIAWDGSVTASRAVHAALPILPFAEKITVVIVDNGHRYAGEPGADVALYLSRHGLNVSIDHVPAPSGDVAAALLNYISDNGIDMAVMGGYGHSRFREFVVGGATRSMLESMTIPVVMAH
ncbi:universal stress protein [Amorphus orientalis]|uniref:Nucleotide-binding universal stress UspA family protein n=1 Tax=Amorphus orientalis TaxID=649198 RepID=A0AAE3VSZ2_9HYPH|nr:universal stress protein [Amorphus orientalis]MDQ0317260.1 nucleotide-binding universal stress UspA family protein [Amorphus orientalis]